MTRVPIREGKLIYHLTHINNLESIIQCGLLSRNDVQNRCSLFSDVADPNIIKKRGRGLGAYIPFHFHPRTAFDYAVVYNHGRENLIYLCVTREYARANEFKVLPKHPLTTQIKDSTLMDYDNGIASIDWEKMEREYSDNNIIKQVRMAECLTDKSIPFRDLRCIFYLTPDQKDKIESILRKRGISYSSPYINDGTNFHHHK